MGMLSWDSNFRLAARCHDDVGRLLVQGVFFISRSEPCSALQDVRNNLHTHRSWLVGQMQQLSAGDEASCGSKGAPGLMLALLASLLRCSDTEVARPSPAHGQTSVQHWWCLAVCLAPSMQGRTLRKSSWVVDGLDAPGPARALLMPIWDHCW